MSKLAEIFTIAFPEVDVAGVYHKNHEQGVPAGPVDKGADSDLYSKPSAVLAQDINVWGQ